MTSIRSRIRPHLAGLQTFSSAEPPELQARKAGIPESEIIRLNANENPYGCSPKVAEAVSNVPYEVYPDPMQTKVRRALAGFTGFSEDRIVAGAGSDELIDLLFRLFMEPGDKIIDSEPTFGMYSFDARVNGCEITLVQRDESFDVDVEAVTEAIDDRTKMIFLTSPNNPTGNIATDAQLRALLETELLIVVDEAYYEFSGETAAALVLEYENLVVLRTMSKWAGLAGLRLGYGFMSPVIVEHILEIKQPYNITTAAEAALLASIDDADALLANVDRIVRERERMYAWLQDLPGVDPRPSRGNYILCEFEPGRAGPIFDELAKQGIFLRKFSSDRLKDFFRISVGRPEQTDAVMNALAKLL